MIKSAIEELTGYQGVHVNDRDDIILDDKWKISGSAARLLRKVIPFGSGPIQKMGKFCYTGPSTQYPPAVLQNFHSQLEAFRYLDHNAYAVLGRYR